MRASEKDLPVETARFSVCRLVQKVLTQSLFSYASSFFSRSIRCHSINSKLNDENIYNLKIEGPKIEHVTVKSEEAYWIFFFATSNLIVNKVKDCHSTGGGRQRAGGRRSG